MRAPHTEKKRPSEYKLDKTKDKTVIVRQNKTVKARQKVNT